MNRQAIVQRHNPVLHGINLESPLTVGNGECAFTADITGLQSLYSQYAQANAPLCTQSHWAWHTIPAPAPSGLYTLADLEMTEYEHPSRGTMRYAVEAKPGNEAVYTWLRQNPHRLNLAKIALLWNGRPLRDTQLSQIRQELDLYTGILYSSFVIEGVSVEVETVFARRTDTVGFSLRSAALADGRLTVSLCFPHGSHKITASDWERPLAHTTQPLHGGGHLCLLKRTLDGDVYYAALNASGTAKQTEAHSFEVSKDTDRMSLSVTFAQTQEIPPVAFEAAREESERGWAEFWESGALVDFSGSSDPRAAELERRTILSLYLIAVHSAGSQPPQETGLACNSWYGKFHLEMHPLHSAGLPLWGRGELLERSLEWYVSRLDKARENAARNGYRGARWPKMVGPEGVDCPSVIATLLVWQQPHLLYMLELLRAAKPAAAKQDFMKKYFPLVRETAEFMVDFALYNEKTGVYDLPGPLIPAQEEHDPRLTRNPAFELCYWRFGLAVAADWARTLGENAENWAQIGESMALPAVHEGLYMAHENCPDTFPDFAKDHPSMLYGYGFIPCERIDEDVMAATLDKVLECWNLQTTWGWDFALMAMTLARLGRHSQAIDILLMDTPKNSYVASGNNYQRGRTDLPLYLPGNGSLLLALPLLTESFNRSPGWRVKTEGLMPFPF